MVRQISYDLSYAELTTYGSTPVTVVVSIVFLSLLQLVIIGTFHHISEKHMDRYVSEFAFRWNNRKISDFEHTITVIAGVNGKRLKYKRIIED